ncbi:hypothetical protein [Saccharopolyspora sp. 6V]|uniref:hypothetical protein n=1 Tax=Saccharopolyspora sp. 6V TaxID=2877239 RepID=UPI001CD4A7A2|nr:hypothetical protein [Saccharopolyspora sp. 6V]MCA1195115.1 hypothetical protein [Saccharopolyspora sp. 6V]
MTDTPVTVLHREPHGLTFHQTAPLRRAGYVTIEQIADLVEAHYENPDESALAEITGMGTARVAAVCDAIDRWTATGRTSE